MSRKSNVNHELSPTVNNHGGYNNLVVRQQDNESPGSDGLLGRSHGCKCNFRFRYWNACVKFITCKSIRSCCFCRPIKVNAMFSFSKACIFVVQEQCIAGRFALYSSKQFLWTSSCYSASKVTYLKTTEKVKLGLQNNGMFNDFLYLFVNLLLER